MTAGVAVRQQKQWAFNPDCSPQPLFAIKLKVDSREKDIF
jgi:hypothetical protein